MVGKNNISDSRKAQVITGAVVRILGVVYNGKRSSRAVGEGYRAPLTGRLLLAVYRTLYKACGNLICVYVVAARNGEAHFKQREFLRPQRLALYSERFLSGTENEILNKIGIAERMGRSYNASRSAGLDKLGLFVLHNAYHIVEGKHAVRPCIRLVVTDNGRHGNGFFGRSVVVAGALIYK